jgi:serine protease AprX
VIVRTEVGAAHRVADEVRALGGMVAGRLRLIRALTVQMPAASLPRLSGLPGVLAVTPDARVRLLGFEDELGYDPGKQNGSMRRVIRAIEADKVLKDGVTGRGVDIALIDSGVAAVEDLQGQVLDGPDLSFDSQDPEWRHRDGFGHGTHMAGIIVGRDRRILRQNDLDKEDYFTGVAPGARIVNVKVGARDGAVDVSQVIAAIDWVIQHRSEDGLNIRVLNLSFGTDSTQDYVVDPLAYAAEVAWRKGVVVVVAGGNAGKQSGRLSDPAIDPYLIAVGAIDLKSKEFRQGVSVFASRGDGRRGVDVVAPGRSIVSSLAPRSEIAEEHPDAVVGSRFFKGSGTSQAAAVVSGAVALILERHPELTPDQVKWLLMTTARPLRDAPAGDQGAGLISVEHAVQMKNKDIPDVRQDWPRATGLGSLELARGGEHVLHAGDVLRGEQDIFGNRFDATEWSGRSWTGRSWSGGDWMDAPWTGRSWTDAGWASRTWASREWTSELWSGRSWSGGDWSGRSWTGGIWDDPCACPG